MFASGAQVNPDSFALYQNDPNPVRLSTSIAFKLPVPVRATLKIYDLGGRVLDTLVDEDLGPGIWSFDWSRGTLGAGVYLYELSMDGESITKEMLIE
jgi:hypothetical protein